MVISGNRGSSKSQNNLPEGVVHSGHFTPMSPTLSPCIELKPSLNGVTVFTNRAKLDYISSVNLDCGTHLLRLSSGVSWGDVLPNTLQVNVQDGAHQTVSVHGVCFKHTDTTEEVRKRVQTLQEEVSQVQEDLDAISDKRKVHSAVVAAVEKVEAKFLNVDEQDGNARPPLGAPLPGWEIINSFISQPTSWAEFVSFITGRKREAKEALLRLKREEAKLLERLTELQKDVTEARSGKQLERRNTAIEVTVSVHEGPLNLRLSVSFVVKGASWSSLFDIRVNSKTATMVVTYYAQVEQNTAVDWRNVQLRVSTATPRFGAQPPTLSTWKISLKPPLVLMQRPSGFVHATPGPMLTAMPRCVADDSRNGPRDPMVEETVVSSSTPFSGAISSFDIAGTVTLSNDDKPTRVVIARQEIPVELEYHANPKCDCNVYRVAKATNKGVYTYLPGKCNVSVDGTFVCSSKMNFVPAGADFKVFLGPAKELDVVRREVKRSNSNVQRLMSPLMTRMDLNTSSP
ncbi:unnamed protein product, partial [Trypanosoma congolense IL3000]